MRFPLTNCRSEDLETRSRTALELAHSLSNNAIDHVILLPSTSPKAADFLNVALTYLETPPHQRSRLFTPGEKPIDSQLEFLASLPEDETTLEHHLTIPKKSPYRDGVTLRAEHWQTKHRLVNVGLPDGILASIPEAFPKRVRLAVRLSSLTPAQGERSIPADIVSPTEAREELGQYMGYTISSTPALSTMFEECPFEGGYDFSVLVSEGGETDIAPLQAPETLAALNYLVVMCTKEKLEEMAKADKQLQELGLEDPAQLFDHAVQNEKAKKSVDSAVENGLEILKQFLTSRLMTTK